ncbi:unnamed protein product [Gadus morhua 'NCC']
MWCLQNCDTRRVGQRDGCETVSGECEKEQLACDNGMCKTQLRGVVTASTTVGMTVTKSSATWLWTQDKGDSLGSVQDYSFTCKDKSCVNKVSLPLQDQVVTRWSDASIISDRWLLSAAHCFKTISPDGGTTWRPAGDYSGMQDQTKQAGGGAAAGLKTIVSHPDYHP